MPGRRRRGLRSVFSLLDEPEDIEIEIEHHLREAADALEAAGRSPAEARREAERRFGDPRRHREELVRINRRGATMRKGAEGWGRLRGEVVRAARSLRRNPRFSLGVLAMFAIGIGVNGAMFGIADRLLLRPPDHVRDAEAVRRVFLERSFLGTVSLTETLTYPDLVDLRSVVGFEAVGGHAGPRSMIVGHGSDAVEVAAAGGSHDFFRTLGVAAARGRFFSPEEGRVDAPPTAVLGWDYWMRAFGGAPEVLGSGLEISGVSHTIIGVAPPGFTGAELRRVDIWLPLERYGALQWGSDDFRTSRGTWWLDVVVRVPDAADGAGVGVAGAEAEATALHLNARADEIAAGRYDPDARLLTGPLIAARGPLASDASRVAGWLIGVAGLVLLIACANVANLLLARAVQRRRERAVRLSLGISRGGLMRDSLLETLLLALGGGVLAVVLAGWGGGLLRGILIPEVHWPESGLDGRVVVFTAAAALFAAIVAGVGPAVRDGRAELADELRGGARGEASRHSRTRGVLAVGQVALSVVLLVGAGLFVRSLHEVRRLDMGIDVDRVLTVALETTAVEPSAADVGRVYEAAARSVSSIPGVGSAALSTVPFGWSLAEEVGVPGLDSMPVLPGGGPYFAMVDDRYFSTLGLTVLAGRGFEPSDLAPAAPVAVVSETMARTLWPAEGALGRCLHRGDDPAPVCTTVVGVVEDASSGSIQEKPFMAYYLPLDGTAAPRALFLRAEGGPADVAARIAPVLRSFSPEVRYARVETLRELLDPQARAWSLGASLFTGFGLLALLVASVGLYSLLAFDVAERTRELGIRAALGAQRVELLRSVLLRGIRLAAWGVIVGATVAVLIAPRVEALLFGVPARDPWVVGSVALALLGVAAVASSLPALRATRVDPMTALRAD